MENILSILDKYSRGVGIFILMCFSFVILVQWILYILGVGRYKVKSDGKPSGSFVTVFTDLLVKIINDFRHLLALILVLIFAIALSYALYTHHGTLADLTGALQAVMATLGGLVGSIVGYYFGESAALRTPDKPDNQKGIASASTAVQQEKDKTGPGDPVAPNFDPTAQGG